MHKISYWVGRFNKLEACHKTLLADWHNYDFTTRRGLLAELICGWPVRVSLRAQVAAAVKQQPKVLGEALYSMIGHKGTSMVHALELINGRGRKVLPLSKVVGALEPQQQWPMACHYLTHAADSGDYTCVQARIVANRAVMQMAQPPADGAQMATVSLALANDMWEMPEITAVRSIGHTEILTLRSSSLKALSHWLATYKHFDRREAIRNACGDSPSERFRGLEDLAEVKALRLELR